VKAQGGVKVTIEVVKDIRDRTTIDADGSHIVGFSCANNTSGMGTGDVYDLVRTILNSIQTAI
jgi:hypothetical protein